MPARDQELFAALRRAGMSQVPTGFSVVPASQEIPAAILAEIDEFIRTFDRVTSRPIWRRAVTASAPELARAERREICFFSAWDIHVPPEDPEAWQLIEFNDNGSGFLFAALINRFFYEIYDPGERHPLELPPSLAVFAERLMANFESEAAGFPAPSSADLLLILDDPDSLERGRFRDELLLLAKLMRQRGWQVEIGSPSQTRWDARRLLFADRPVGFVVNRSTDFFWAGDAFAALRAAYREGGVYVAPNPFSYATRSDKGLFALLSRPGRDDRLGIEPRDRAALSAHVPETWCVSAENVDALVGRKDELVFKPTHGYASRGVLASNQVGRSRLRRLLRKGESYVAQRRVPRSPLRLSETDDSTLWADLRVWSYRGQRYALSGRASCRPDALDLTPPGGWIPTYARRAEPSVRLPV